MDAISRNRRVVGIEPGAGRAIAKPIVALAARVVRRFASALERYRQHRVLAGLDDHLLKDIGLTRADVICETAKPIWRHDATADQPKGDR